MIGAIEGLFIIPVPAYEVTDQMNQQTDTRIFRRGAWDLRRLDRRKEQLTIEFPERRKNDRRMADLAENVSGGGMLQWVDPYGG